MARILLVDDTDDVREFMRMLLVMDEHEVLEAADGEAALASIREDHPDLVLLDLHMPIMDGFEVLEALQQSPVAGHRTKIVVLTADGGLDNHARAVELGATRTFNKLGVSLETLNQLVREELETVRAR